MVWSPRSMTYFWIRSTSSWNLPVGSANTSLFTPHINTSNNIIIKSGMKETDTSTTTSTHPTTLKIRPKTLTEVSGPLTSSKSGSGQEESTTFTTLWLAIISRPPTEWTFPKENTSTLTLITWSLVCPDNYMMVCLISKTVPLPPPLKWPMTSPTSSSLWTEEVVGLFPINKSESGCGLLLAFCWSPSDTWTHTDSTETCSQPESKCTQSETHLVTSTGNQDSRALRPLTTETHTGHDWFIS